MQAQTSQQCIVVSFDTYCMNARGKINIYDIPILSFNISLDNPNLANLVSRHKQYIFPISYLTTNSSSVLQAYHDLTCCIVLKGVFKGGGVQWVQTPSRNFQIFF